MTQLRWINHACYLLEHGPVRLAHDPWLDGPAFDGGWELLAPTRFAAEDFDAVSHIWFSHEHPDHFVPGNLMAIPPAVRARIHVLYQASVDRRVARFCEKAGFAAVTELQPGRWLRLAEDLELLCEPHDNGDSWLATRAGGRLWLNLNDCVITSPRECRALLAKLGRVDVLLSQFSYANWVGNPGEDARMQDAAREKLGWLLTQVKALDPTWVVPFASHVYFAHADNFFLNEHVNRIHRVVEAIESETRARPVVLYPGDLWKPDPDERIDNAPSLARYAADWERVLSAGPTRHAERVPLDTLIEHGEAFAARLRQANGALTRLLPAAHVLVEDHGVVLRVATRGVAPLAARPARVDLACKSDALDYAFRFEWGGRTLDINGRFSVPSGGQYARFKALATLAGFNNRAEGFGAIGRTLVQRAAKRVRAG